MALRMMIWIVMVIVVVRIVMPLHPEEAVLVHLTPGFVLGAAALEMCPFLFSVVSYFQFVEQTVLPIQFHTSAWSINVIA